MSDELKKLAAMIRESAAEYEKVKAEKCANVLRAAVGLNLLNKKLRGTDA